MFYLEYTNAEGTKLWELQSQEWEAVEALLATYGVKAHELDVLREMQKATPSETWGEELDDLLIGGCLALDGEPGPWTDGQHPLRRGAEFAEWSKAFEAGRVAGIRERADKDKREKEAAQ